MTYSYDTDIFIHNTIYIAYRIILTTIMTIIELITNFLYQLWIINKLIKFGHM